MARRGVHTPLATCTMCMCHSLSKVTAVIYMLHPEQMMEGPSVQIAQVVQYLQHEVELRTACYGS